MSDQPELGLERYKRELLDRGPLDYEALECFGHHGYRTGRQLPATAATASMRRPGPGKITGSCTDCRRESACWDATRDQARQLWPELCAQLDELTAAGITGADYIRAWTNIAGDPPPPDPFMALEITDLEIGAAHANLLDGPPAP